MFKACLYTTLLHACMLMQEKGNSDLCECILNEMFKSQCSSASHCLIFLSIFFLEEEEDWYYFVYVRAEGSVNL